MAKSRDSAVGWRVVRKRLADGAIREYRYPTDARRASAAEPDTLQALSLAWRASPEWRRYAPRTQATYLTHLREIEQAPAAPISALRRRDFLAWRDRISQRRGDGAARMWLAVVATMLAWGVQREWLDASPLRAIGGAPHVPLPAWSMADYEAAHAALPERLRRAIVLALHTGQRAGDLVKMRWDEIAGDVLRVEQRKTGARLMLPLHDLLARELQAWRAEKTTPFILERRLGVAWTQHQISDAMALHLAKIGMKGKGLHGLRKLCAATLAEGGASAHEIAAVTGHRTLEMVQHYTRSADQARLARAALGRVNPVGEQLQSQEKTNVKSIR